MKQCNNCGRQIPDEAHFCPFCATVQNKKTEAPLPKPPRLKRRAGLIAAAAALTVLAVMLIWKNQAKNLQTNFAGHHYRVIAEPMLWEDAKTYCEEQNGYLACISSQEEADAVQSILQPKLTKKDDGLGGFWIGAYKEIAQQAEWEWVNGAPLTFTKWAGGNPDNSGSVVKAVIDEDHPWDDTPSEEHCPVYEIEPENIGQGTELTNAAGSGEGADTAENEIAAEAERIADELETARGVSCKSMVYGGHVYILLEERMDWETALSLPEEAGFNGYLACFESGEEYTAVSAIMQSELEEDRTDCWGGFWIGLCQKTPEQAVWKWVSQEDFSYQNWAEGQPDSSGYSAKIVPDWGNQWDDISWEKHCFVCEWDDPESVPGEK